MIKLGEKQELLVIKKVEFGVYLAEEMEAEEKVLLPAKQVPKDASIGSKIEVFIYKDSDGNENISLIDWEYAGMQDPHVDIAMFCIYSLYDKSQSDNLIDTYFKACGKEADEDTRTKIYCYIAACGLLWSNWCEYKSTLGVEFGEYSLRQYRYAKDFYKIAAARIGDKK